MKLQTLPDCSLEKFLETFALVPYGKTKLELALRVFKQ